MMNWEDDFVQASDEELEKMFDRIAEIIIAKVAKRMGMKDLIDGAQSHEFD